MHADRINRLALTLFGLLMLAAGAGALVASAGGFGTASSRRPLFANRVSGYIGAHGTWLWPVAAAACLLLTLAALRWILALLVSTDRTSDIAVPGSKDHGTTILQAAALTGALSGELQTYHGVASAKARVLGFPADPQIVITVTAEQAADLSALHRRIETEALAHARQALKKPELPIQLNLDVTRRPA